MIISMVTFMELIAWFVIVASVTKFLFLIIDKKGFFEVSKGIMPMEAPWLPLLGLGLFLYLRTRGLSSIEMMSSIMILSFFAGGLLAPYSKPLMTAMQKDKKFMSKVWLTIVCWFIIVAVTIFELL